MNLKNSFSRSAQPEAMTANNEIICDTVALKELISQWAQNDGWNSETFADFLRLIGIDMPAKLCELNNQKEFKCITALGSELKISLAFRGETVSHSEIIVTKGDARHRYVINNIYEKNGNSSPKILGQITNITQGDTGLNSYYHTVYWSSQDSHSQDFPEHCAGLSHIILKFGETHILSIALVEFYNYVHDCQNFVKNCTAFDNYLLGLSISTLDVHKICSKIVELLGFSKDSDKIAISFFETRKQKMQLLSQLILDEGNFIDSNL